MLAWVENKARELDPGSKGITIEYGKDSTGIPSVTLNIRNMSIRDVLKFTAEITGHRAFFVGNTVLFAQIPWRPGFQTAGLFGTCIDAETEHPITNLAVNTFCSKAGPFSLTKVSADGRFLALVPYVADRAYLDDIVFHIPGKDTIACEFSAPGYHTQTNRVFVGDTGLRMRKPLEIKLKRIKDSQSGKGE